MNASKFGKALVLPCAVAAFMALAGCEEEGPMEEAGEQMDEAAEGMQESMDDAMDEMRE